MNAFGHRKSLLWEGRILPHRPLPFSCPGCPVSPGALLAVVLPWTSSTTFAISGLLWCCHVVRLERCAFVFCTHAARTCARAACANSHSQDQAVIAACPGCLRICHTTCASFFHIIVPTLAYPGRYPVAFAFSSNPALKGMRVVPCSSYRPPMRAVLRVIPFR